MIVIPLSEVTTEISTTIGWNQVYDGARVDLLFERLQGVIQLLFQDSWQVDLPRERDRELHMDELPISSIYLSRQVNKNKHTQFFPMLLKRFKKKDKQNTGLA